jgi:hypothetical protein
MNTCHIVTLSLRTIIILSSHVRIGPAGGVFRCLDQNYERDDECTHNEIGVLKPNDAAWLILGRSGILSNVRSTALSCSSYFTAVMLNSYGDSETYIQVYPHFGNCLCCCLQEVGRVSVVGIATRYGLGGPRIESRWWWDFRTRPDGPCVPASLLYNG